MIPIGRGEAAIEDAIGIGIVEVAGVVNALVVIDLIPGEIGTARSGAGDEIVVYNVVAEFGAGMGGVTGGAVVEDVVDEDIVHLGQRVAVVGIGEEAVKPRPGAADGFGVRAELLAGRIGDETVLKGDVGDGGGLPGIADAIDVVPGGKLHGHMIADDIAGVVEAQGVVAGAGGFAAGADAEVAADDVAAAGKGNFAAAKADAAAGGGLAGDGEVALGGNGGFQGDVAADIKDDDAVGGADGIAERAGAAVGKGGDVIDGAAASAGGIGAETEGTGKGDGLGVEQRRGQAGGQPNQSGKARPGTGDTAKGGKHDVSLFHAPAPAIRCLSDFGVGGDMGAG